ncbi:MAG: ABC transporter permease [Gammaproteobacteria bacterium]
MNRRFIFPPHLCAVWTVYLKEVRENLRDRRTVINALVTGPLLGPVLFGLLFSFTLQRQLADAVKPLPVPVIGAAYAPHLIHALEAQGMVVKPPPRNARAAIRAHVAQVVLVIPSDYDRAWDAGEPSGVELYYDSSRQGSHTPVTRLKRMLKTYAGLVVAQRLFVRGISPLILRPVVPEDRDLATPQSRSALMFSILPYFFVLTVFLGGMYLAIDTTAGERERQSLEPLLVNPVSRGAILSGKIAATVSFALVSLTLSIIAFSVVGRFLPVEKLDVILDLGPRFALFVLLLMLPLAVLLVTLQTIVSAFAKSYREAQTYLSILMLLPVIPSLLLSVMPLRARTWMYAVPLLGQQLGIMDLVRGETVSGVEVIACLIGSSVAALLAILLARELYASERLAVSA